MSSGNWKSNCQWCWSFDVVTAFIAHTMNNKHQDECNQCFDDNTLDRFHISSQSSNSQFSSQNYFWRCKLKHYRFNIKPNFLYIRTSIFAQTVLKHCSLQQLTYFDNSSTAHSSQALCDYVGDRLQNATISTNQQSNCHGGIDVTSADVSKCLQEKKNALGKDIEKSVRINMKYKHVNRCLMWKKCHRYNGT